MTYDKDRKHESDDVMFVGFDVGTNDSTIVARRSSGANIETWKAGPMLIQCRPAGAGKIGCKTWVDQIYVGASSMDAVKLAANQGVKVRSLGSSFVSRQATIKVADPQGNLQQIIHAPFVLIPNFHPNTDKHGPKWIADEIWFSDADFTHANDQAGVKVAGDKCTELERMPGDCKDH